MNAPRLTAAGSLLPAGRAGAWLALGAGAVAAASVAVAVVAPVLHWYQSRAHEIACRQQQVLAIERLLPELPAMRRQVAALETGDDDRRLFLAGSSATIAGANLQAAILLLAAEAHAGSTSTAPFSEQPAGGLTRITIDVRMTANWTALVALLSAIDLAHPRMLVSDLTIVADGQGSDDRLRIGFAISAFRAGGA